jgi:FkbM family methyltransferase
VAFAARPLQGKALPVRAGEAAGLLLRGERRSVAWLTGKVEPEVQAALVRLLQPGSTFFDVGAGIGFFSLLAARSVGPAGRVVSFEPGPEHAASVRANVELNDLANVTVVESALSDRIGPAYLADPREATAALASGPGGGAVTVGATTLDAFLAARPEFGPDVVKIDAEGHETRILDGMAETLARHRPHVVVELHGDLRVVRVLEDVGYACTLLEAAPSIEAARAWGHVLAAPREETG